jgi:hypothetical protein
MKRRWVGRCGAHRRSGTRGRSDVVPGMRSNDRLHHQGGGFLGHPGIYTVRPDGTVRREGPLRSRIPPTLGYALRSPDGSSMAVVQHPGSSVRPNPLRPRTSRPVSSLRSPTPARTSARHGSPPAPISRRSGALTVRDALERLFAGSRSRSGCRPPTIDIEPVLLAHQYGEEVREKKKKKNHTPDGGSASYEVPDRDSSARQRVPPSPSHGDGCSGADPYDIAPSRSHQGIPIVVMGTEGDHVLLYCLRAATWADGTTVRSGTLAFTVPSRLRHDTSSSA